MLLEKSALDSEANYSSLAIVKTLESKHFCALWDYFDRECGSLV